MVGSVATGAWDLASTSAVSLIAAGRQAANKVPTITSLESRIKSRRLNLFTFLTCPSLRMSKNAYDLSGICRPRTWNSWLVYLCPTALSPHPPQ